jgi:hypothetical protein
MLKKRLLGIANVPLRALGLSLHPTWQVQWWTSLTKFQFAGREFTYLYHTKAGFPPSRVTERCVELPLAGAWLDAVPAGEVYEVGAVTPYYWPGRVGRVIDPYDTHARVTHRTSVMDVDLRGADVLSISTLEHVGTGDYGLPREPGAAVAAFQKVFREARRLFITIPIGQNSELDEFFFWRSGCPADVSARYMIRSAEGNNWVQALDRTAAEVPYGEKGYSQRSWANGIMVFERGGLL